MKRDRQDSRKEERERSQSDIPKGIGGPACPSGREIELGLDPATNATRLPQILIVYLPPIQDEEEEERRGDLKGGNDAAAACHPARSPRSKPQTIEKYIPIFSPLFSASPSLPPSPRYDDGKKRCDQRRKNDASLFNIVPLLSSACSAVGAFA